MDQRRRVGARDGRLNLDIGEAHCTLPVALADRLQHTQGRCCAHCSPPRTRHRHRRRTDPGTRKDHQTLHRRCRQLAPATVHRAAPRPPAPSPHLERRWGRQRGPPTSPRTAEGVGCAGGRDDTHHRDVPSPRGARDPLRERIACHAFALVDGLAKEVPQEVGGSSAPVGGVERSRRRLSWRRQAC
jgi:hypothetical protein